MNALRDRLRRTLPRRLSTRLLFAVGAPLALATLAGLTIYGALNSALAAQADIERIEQVVEAAGTLRLHVVNAQTGLRGFLIAGDESFLAPYEDAVREWPLAVSDLERHLTGNRLQTDRLHEINGRFLQWRRQIAEPILAGRRETPPEHVDAAIEARSRLIELSALFSLHRDGGSTSQGDVQTSFLRFRASVETALRTAHRDDLIDGWTEVLARTDRFAEASGHGFHSSDSGAALGALAPATALVSELTMERHRELILPVTTGVGKRLVEQMHSTDEAILQVERERLDTAVERVEARRRAATWIAAGSLVFAVGLGLFISLTLARRLLIPIHSITRASESLERGDLSARAVSLADDEIGRLARTFNGMADRLGRRDREFSRLHELSQPLQTSADADEAIEIFERLTPVLLPGGSGTLHTISASRIDLELRASFGPQPPAEDELAAPNDCWALRKGQSHLVESADRKLVCAHLGGRDGLRDPYACLPLISQGEMLGLLHVSFPIAALEGESIEKRREELEAIANALGLALGNLALREKLKAQSVRDALTGLYNRRFLEEAMPREIERCRRREQPLVVAMADLDHFKRLNDTWGHEAGDLAIQRFAEALRKNFRQEDILCRYGGEEFCLVLPECSLADARRRCEELLAQMRGNPFRFGREIVGPVTLSLGLVAFPEDADSGEGLIRAADSALYRAKQAGRDRIVKYQPGPVAA